MDCHAFAHPPPRMTVGWVHTLFKTNTAQVQHWFPLSSCSQADARYKVISRCGHRTIAKHGRSNHRATAGHCRLHLNRHVWHLVWRDVIEKHTCQSPLDVLIASSRLPCATTIIVIEIVTKMCVPIDVEHAPLKLPCTYELGRFS